MVLNIEITITYIKKYSLKGVFGELIVKFTYILILLFYHVFNFFYYYILLSKHCSISILPTFWKLCINIKLILSQILTIRAYCVKVHKHSN